MSGLVSVAAMACLHRFSALRRPVLRRLVLRRQLLRASLASAFASALVCVSAFGMCVVGCGSDSHESAAVSVGPPSFSIVEPLDGSCVALRDNPGSTIPVRIGLTNWLLRPYGYCGMQYLQCGYAVFVVDGVEVMRSAAIVSDVPFAGVSSPVGTHVLRVELRDDADAVVLDDAGELLAREVTIRTVDAGETCAD